MKNLSKINKRNEVLEIALKKRELARNIKCGDLKPYLYQFVGKETPEDFQRRLNETYFFNIIDNTINNYVSKPFKKDFRITEKSNDLSADQLNENFDGQGNNVTDFLKLVLKEGLYFSQTHVFTDLIIDNGEITHTVNLIDLSDFIDYEYNKKGDLIYLRFRCEEHIRIDFDIKKYLVIKEFYVKDNKVFWNDYISTNYFTKITQKDGMSFKERNIDQPFGLDYIPLRSFYPIPTSNKFNPDLLFSNAFELQLTHFKTGSRLKYNELIYSTASRVLKTGNVDNNEDRTLDISAKKMTIIDSNDEMYWDIPPYQILASYRSEMGEVSKEINEIMGNILFGRTNGTTTATENVLLSSSTNNFLSSVSNSLQWFAEKIIEDIRDFKNILGVEFETSIITDYSVGLNQTEVSTLFQLYSIGGISLEDLFEEMKRRNIFDDYLTFKETMAKLYKEDAIKSGVVERTEITDEKLILDDATE